MGRFSLSLESYTLPLDATIRIDLWVSRLWIPSPPSSSGRHARSHATGQCPPFTWPVRISTGIPDTTRSFLPPVNLKHVFGFFFTKSLDVAHR